MAIAKILSWLEDPNRSYEYGKSLYEQYGDDVVILAVIRGGSSPYHSNKLFDALVKLNETAIDRVVKPKDMTIPDLQAFADPIREPVKKKPDFHSLPDAMKDVTSLKNQHKRRTDQLFIEISFTESEELRREMASTMLDDLDKVQECWGILDGFRETGLVLDNKKPSIEEEVKGMTMLQLSNSVRNIRTYLTKDKKRAMTMKPGRQLTKVLTRIQENQLKLSLIDQALKNGVV